MPINISQKRVNITGLGWIVKAKYIIDRKKKSQNNYPSAAMQRGSRHQNSPEPIILGIVVSLTKSSNDTSS